MTNPVTPHLVSTGADESSQRWRPLLTGERQAAALATVAAIAEHLCAQPPLASHSPDLALFFAYLSQAETAEKANAAHKAAALAWLERMLDYVAVTPLPVALYGGLAGAGWTLAHVGPYLGAEDEESSAVIDEVLYEHVGQTPWQGEYDLIGGLVGIGVYALERLPNPLAVALLERLVERLAELAVVSPAGITWFTPPALLPDHQRAALPHGYYNLGVAHGVPGVVALLGRVLQAGVAVSKTRPLLDGAVRWLLAQELAAPSTVDASSVGSGFPSWVAPAVVTKSVDKNPLAQQTVAQLAWCYGDLGIAATLLGVARLVNKPAWESAALRIARRAAQRAPEQSGVQDGCLCHGAAGLAHLFNRLYQATGEPQLGDTARFWFDQTLTTRRPAGGVAGYSFRRGQQGWEDSPGFLEGAAGIGLALLAAATPFVPAWDRLLLLDTPLR